MPWTAFCFILADVHGLFFTNNDVEEWADMFAELQVGDMRISSFLCFNPLKPNGISLYYQLEQSIPNFRGVGWHLFYQTPKFNRRFYTQTVKFQITHHIMCCLIWLYTICLSLI